MNASSNFKPTSAEITLWPLRSVGFDLSKYWGALVEEENVVSISSEANLSDVLDLTRRREFPKRTLASLPLVLGPNVEVGVKLYATVLETKLPYPVQMETRVSKPLKISTRWLCQTQAQHLDPDQILLTSNYGPLGAVVFSAEDKKRVKRFGVAGIQILGFKPMETLDVVRTFLLL